MKQGNIFEGDSAAAQLAVIVYRMLMKREWVCNRDFMVEYMNPRPVPDLLTACESYGDLKKAVMEVRRALEEKIPGCIVERGNNRNKSFFYTGEDNNPLADLQNAAIIRDVRTYFEFCQDSAGLLPQSWLEHFFRNTKDLLEIRKRRSRGGQIIATDDRQLRNIDLLPLIYEHIRRQEVIRITYKPFNHDSEKIVMHPHYLKEYNGRWFLFGHVDGKLPEHGYNVALDRIEGTPCPADVPFIHAKKDFYEQKFKAIVGVTTPRICEMNKVRVRVYGNYYWGLVTTKPIHPSQKEVLAINDYDGEVYGEIEIDVIINKELIGRILHYGDALEVREPKALREKIAESISHLKTRYDIDL